ncbi:cupin superfamily protein [Colletotrichum falcatum]|nr:cupin superfamily protein [Colletotrichum falcatum]
MRFSSHTKAGGIFAFMARATPAAPTKPSPVEERTAQEVIDRLGLVPNEEKGYFIETFRDPGASSSNSSSSSSRPLSTAIYYLLEGSAGPSVWHRVDAAEVWHYYAGAPLALSLSRDDGGPPEDVVLGPDVFQDQRPQVVVAKGRWQRARSRGAWTLVGTTVAPGFVPEGVELADPGWAPNRA